jgi:hypothetical protein
VKRGGVLPQCITSQMPEFFIDRIYLTIFTAIRVNQRKSRSIHPFGLKSDPDVKSMSSNCDVALMVIREFIHATYHAIRFIF